MQVLIILAFSVYAKCCSSMKSTFIPTDFFQAEFYNSYFPRYNFASSTNTLIGTTKFALNENCKML